jgi:TolB-like protein
MVRSFCGVFFTLALALWPVAARAEKAVAPKLTVAISYFDNNTGKPEYAPLAKGIADMLITDLSVVSSLQIVERAHLNKVLSEMKLSRSKFIDPATAQKLGKGLAARFVLAGGYVVANGRLSIDARVFEVATAKVLTSEQVEGKEDEFFSLEKDLVDLLIRTLDVKVASSERSRLRTNATQSLSAFKDYAAGLDYLR